MRLLPGVKKTWLLDDSYNSSPLAALSAVRDLAAFPVAEGAKRIAALGDMLELGALSEDAHIQLGRMVAECEIDMLVTCGMLAHAIGRAAIEAGLSEAQVIHFDRSEQAGLFIQDRIHPGDVVLVKGSQGARMERVTKELMAHPDKAEHYIVRQSPEWLAKT
jgi:UDP-N-acetylmuramyl pentapeptide synthase